MNPKELVSGVVRLVSLPEVCLRVSEMLEDPGVSTAELGRVISRDAGLTARLLKIVNGESYGFPARIETVSRAVEVVAVRELRGLVLAASAIEAFARVPENVLNLAHFWRHSVYCGVVAQLLAERCNVLHSERLFVAGLLHDIGKLVIAHKLPDLAHEVTCRSIDEEQPDFVIEREVLGFDHADVGGALLQEWQMPETLAGAVRHHHLPAMAGTVALDASLVHLADAITGMAEHGLDSESASLPVDEYAWQLSGLDGAIVEPVHEEAGRHFSEALETILPRSYIL
ncbi:MAG: HDOD domain-containing protein [Pseudomonadota bacterium]|nr:MAG: HDOD domain-containing protein [Pseudomonadota bacterium]